MATKEIKLTANQIEIIEKYLRGELSMLGTSIKDMKTFMPVITMAEELMLESKEEIGDDLIIWFYNKYKQQQESVNQTDGSTEGKEEV